MKLACLTLAGHYNLMSVAKAKGLNYRGAPEGRLLYLLGI
jgi:hypothetical protein